VKRAANKRASTIVVYLHQFGSDSSLSDDTASLSDTDSIGPISNEGPVKHVEKKIPYD